MKDNLRRLVEGEKTDAHSALIQVRGLSWQEIGDVVGDSGNLPQANEVITNFPTGTNEILAQLGFRTAGDRDHYLKSFNGDTHYGADMVRAGYQLAVYYGGKPHLNYDKFVDRALSLINFMHHNVQAEVIRRKKVAKMAPDEEKSKANATANADYVVSQVGMINLHEVNGLSAVNFKGDVHLVPCSDLLHIMSNLAGKATKLSSFPAFMESLGYQVSVVNGINNYIRTPRR